VKVVAVAVAVNNHDNVNVNVNVHGTRGAEAPFEPKKLRWSVWG